MSKYLSDEEMKFIECDTCRAKPGSPILCTGCLANRVTIERLKSLRQQDRDTLREMVTDMTVERAHTYASENAGVYRAFEAGQESFKARVLALLANPNQE